MDVEDLSESATASPASPSFEIQDPYNYINNSLDAARAEEEYHTNDDNHPANTSSSYTSASSSHAIRGEYGGSVDSAASRSTTISPRSHSCANSMGFASSDSNTATSPSPYDDELKPMDAQEPVSARSRPRRAGDMNGRRLSPSTLYRQRDDDVVADVDWNEYNSRSPALTHGLTSMRVIPASPSSYLRPGSRFKGTQTSERSVYNVEVEIKHVDKRESFLCGYLHIEGLTPDNPSICTYFEGEIVGSRYGFLTKQKCWGADERTDISHWSQFDAFRPYAKSLKRGLVKEVDFSQKENIFMRWKEHFLVPDHRKSSIPGASFEGFYYICFNQVRGEVTGIYFHTKSEK